MDTVRVNRPFCSQSVAKPFLTIQYFLTRPNLSILNIKNGGQNNNDGHDDTVSTKEMEINHHFSTLNFSVGTHIMHASNPNLYIGASWLRNTSDPTTPPNPPKPTKVADPNALDQCPWILLAW
jgi:hypothetical protein